MARPTRPKTSVREDAEAGALKARFERRVRLSWLALLGERAWEALLWPFVVVASFLIPTLLGGWGVMPPLLHRILLGAFAVALLISFLPLVRLVLPTRAEALRRLERTANIKHRPASSYEDRLGSTPPAETAFLWATHRERLSRLVAKLKPSWPTPRTDRKDPYAIRAALLLGLVVAVLAAGADSGTRLRAAFSPATSASTALLRLDAWVTPPVYTGMAPIVLADGSEAVGAGAETFRALSVPERSQLIVRTHAPEGETVTLSVRKDGAAEAKIIEPKTGGSAGLVEFNIGLMEPLTADVRIGGQTVSQWQFALIEDAPPTISLMGDPTTTPRGALRLLYGALDDYGVASAEARFALAAGEVQAFAPMPPDEETEEHEAAEAEPLIPPPVMPLQLPRTNAKKVEGRATQDLTAHPWAGLKVRMTLVARDQAEQMGESQPYEFVLPQRTFTKPLAKAVVEQRKKLVREPAAQATVARALDALTLGEEKVIDDRVVYLSLRNAYWRLMNDDSRDSLISVVDQLWATALRIEEGDLPDAERELKSAQDALMKALQENAPADEIKQRIEELRAALGRYLQALAAQQQDKGNLPSQTAQDGDQLVSQQDLDKMLKSIEDLAQAGSKDMAERMLSELNDILDRLQTGNFAENAKQQRAGRAMKDLNDVVSDQQKLLDDTFAEKRQQQGEGGGGDQFEVSPPGQPMDFGPGIDMTPFFDQMPQSGQSGAKAQGQSGRQGDAPGGGQTQLGEQQGPQQGNLGELAKRQQALAEKLQNLIDRMRMEGAEAPNQLEGAKEAMDDAEEAIGEPNLDRATQNQSLALDRMRKGAESMAQQMMESGEMQQGQGPGSNGRDPLGRPDRSNRPDLGLSVQVPDEIDIQRAREVLDELRRRLGDPSRPSLELDYLERLIRSF
ncbi:MAG: TIGR02302 family protein [Methyloceanibacter sp.]|uniref:TIGR02302 family protein n=1 Tax=Methyloceanibacter sp. TaxID=1965321 RepID=UPI003D6DA3B0